MAKTHYLGAGKGPYPTCEGPLGARSVPVALLIAAGLPLITIFFVEAYRLPLWVLIVASVPAAAVLVAQRALAAPRSLVLLGMVLFVVATLVSTAVAEPVKPSQFGILAVRGALAVWFMYLLALVVLQGRETFGALLLALVVACGLTAAINAGLLLAADPRALADENHRLIPVVGMARHKWPTTVSATYAIMLVAAFAIAVAPAARRGVRVAAALAGVAIALALALTETRSGYLAAVAGIVAVSACLSRRVLLVTVAAIAVVVAVVLLYPPALESILARGGSYRVATWLRYVSFAFENPLVGTGLTRRLWLMVEGVEIHHAHNMLISSLVRGGVVGLAGMALMLFGGLAYAWRYARTAGSAAIFGMMVAIGVASVFDYDLILTPTDWMWLTFWMPIGLAAGAELSVRRAASAQAETTAST